LILAVTFQACSGRVSTTPSPTASVGPAETATATASAAAPTSLPSVRFVDAFPDLPQLERPVAMVEVPSQATMLAALQEGRIVSFPNEPGTGTLSTVLDWRQKTSRGGNEEGLLGLALDPDFARNGYLYAYYSASAGPRRTVLSRFVTRGSGASLKADPTSEMVLLEVPQPFSNHNGGSLMFGPDGMLYLGLGDGGSAGDPNGNGQDLKNNLLGSIIRIDVRGATAEKPYAIPPDNPFARATDGTRRETWAYGLRNPWRFSFDRQTGLLVAGDVGQDSFEEIDVIKKGGNYGWNIMEGDHCYKPARGCDQTGLGLPVVVYPHENGACSVTGGYVYRGQAVKGLQGAYIYADYCSGAVWAIPSFSSNGVHAQPVQLRAKGPEVSSFAEDEAGELYLLSFDGRVYRIAS
jgi:glucose/arabinose dehydrogenase